MPRMNIKTMHVSRLYESYSLKLKRKNIDTNILNHILCWFTGYKMDTIIMHMNNEMQLEHFFNMAPHMHPKVEHINGSICGVKIETIEDPFMKVMRRLDKLVDLAYKGKSIDVICPK